MKKKILVYSFVCISILIHGIYNSGYTEAINKDRISGTKNSNKKPVLIELFTSESCFACPPAEMALAKIENEQPFEDTEVITLEFHVDYRDGFGRKDDLASSLFTQRQRVYDRKFRTGKIYTPQMVVDGDIEFIGSDLKKAKKAIDKTIKNDKSNIALSFDENRLKISVKDIPKHDYATVYLAIAEDGIITRDRKTIDKANVSVVRRLNGLGRILPNENKYELNVNYQINKDWNRENLKLIVFIQENGTRNILGVEKIKVETTNAHRKP